jgi:muconate cycloisomerase
MRIANIQPIAVSLPMKKPMKMSGVEIRNGENALVRITTDTGVVGWGEAAAAPNMTGETVESMMAAIRYTAPFLIGSKADGFDAVHAEMDWRMVGNHAAKATIDIALHDIAGRARGVPVHALLGEQRRKRAPVLWLVGTGSTEGDVREALERKAQGFTAYKIKVGAESPEADGVRTRAVCEALGKGLLISADVNQAWTVAQTMTFLKAVGKAPLDFLEQPIRGDDIAGMARIAAASRIAIGADEGLHGIAEIERHHTAGAAKGGSLKTIKFGGVGPAYQAGLLCDRLGMKVNLASKVAESSIATAALLHLAAVLPNIDWGLSPSNQYLADDLVKTPCAVVGGQIDVPTGVGLGVEVDEAKVERYARR